MLGSPANRTANFARDVCLGSLARDWYAILPHFLVRPLCCLHLLNMARDFTIVAVTQVSVGRVHALKKPMESLFLRVCQG